jgi:hypothetical protein
MGSMEKQAQCHAQLAAPLGGCIAGAAAKEAALLKYITYFRSPARSGRAIALLLCAVILVVSARP